MSKEEEDAVRGELARAAAEQEALRGRLVALLHNVPPSPREEAIYEEGEEYDFTTEVRSCLECILEDWMRPAIRDLEDLSVFQPGARPAR